MGRSEELPYAADVDSPLNRAEFGVLKNQYEKEHEKGWVTVQTKFNYAWALVKSEDKAEVAQGVALLMDIYRTEPPRRRECLYYIALGHFKLQNYEEAKKYNDILLEKEPRNMQSQSLAALIEKGVSRDGLIGAALAGGAMVIGVAAVALAAMSRRR